MNHFIFSQIPRDSSINLTVLWSRNFPKMIKKTIATAFATKFWPEYMCTFGYSHRSVCTYITHQPKSVEYTCVVHYLALWQTQYLVHSMLYDVMQRICVLPDIFSRHGFIQKAKQYVILLEVTSTGLSSKNRHKYDPVTVISVKLKI